MTGLLVGLMGATPSTASPSTASPSTSPLSTAMVQPGGVVPMSHGYCNNNRRIAVTSTTYIRVPSIGTSGSTHCIMNVGANSPGVGALQQGMNRCYNGPSPKPNINITVDGSYGTGETEPAVRRVQTYHRNNHNSSIVVDGIYGPQTRSAMEWPIFRNSDGGFTFVCVRGFI